MLLPIAHFAPDPFVGMRVASRGVGWLPAPSDALSGLGRLLAFFRWDGRTSADFHFFKGHLTVQPRTFHTQ